jgi:Restriction endonuclease fold toxin 5
LLFQLFGLPVTGTPGQPTIDPNDPNSQPLPGYEASRPQTFADLINIRPADWPDWAKNLLVRAQLTAEAIRNNPNLVTLPITATTTLVDLLMYKGGEQRAEEAWQANQNLRPPKTVVGTSDGGPGQWDYCPTRSGGQDYQEQITNVPRGVEYKVGGVWFDGYDPARNTLIDAKDWNGFVLPGTQFWDDTVIDEASSQVKAAQGTGARVEWTVNSQREADAIREIFNKSDDEKIRNIQIRVVPKR